MALSHMNYITPKYLSLHGVQSCLKTTLLESRVGQSHDCVFNSFHLFVDVRCPHSIISLLRKPQKNKNKNIFPSSASVIPTKRTNYGTKSLSAGLVNVVVLQLCNLDSSASSIPTVSLELSFEIGVSCDLVS